MPWRFCRAPAAMAVRKGSATPLDGLQIPVALLAMTLFMVFEALHLKTDAGLEKQLPLGHPYIKVFKQYQAEFGGTAGRLAEAG